MKSRFGTSLVVSILAIVLTVSVVPFTEAASDEILMSANTNGLPYSAGAVRPIATSDGSKVIFESAYSDMTPDRLMTTGPVGTGSALFRRDVKTSKTELVTISPDGKLLGFTAEPAFAWEKAALASSDGNKIVFLDPVDDLPNDTNGYPDIYMKDMSSGAVSALTIQPNGESAPGAAIRLIDSTDDVRYILVRIQSLGGGPIWTGDKDTHYYRLDTITRETVALPFDNKDYVTSMSNDGRYFGVVENVPIVDGNYSYSIGISYRYDIQTGSRLLLSRSVAGEPARGEQLRLSKDGQHAVYVGQGNDYEGVNDTESNVFWIDINTLTTRWVDDLIVQYTGTEQPAISNDGSVVTFIVRANVGELYAKNMQTFEQVKLSNGDVFIGGSNHNVWYSLSGDGGYVAYARRITNGTYIPQVYRSRAFALATPVISAASPTRTAPVIWWDVDSRATSYEVYRDGVKIGTTSSNSYTDTLVAEGIYSYYVIASNTLGESSPSNRVTVLVDHTAPILGTPKWGTNPVMLGGDTNFIVPAFDDISHATNVSGVKGGEYFVGTDPGLGNATALNWDGTNLVSNSFGADLAPGVYNIGIRAVDTAGNWSPTTTVYLVVFNPSGPGYIVGQQNLTPSTNDKLPWVSNSPRDFATFGFNVKFTNTGTVDSGSKFNFKYDEKGSCGAPNKPACHTFDMVATGFDWLGLGGANNSQGIFQGTGRLTIDGVAQTVVFRVDAVDGDQLAPVQSDSFVLKIYSEGGNPQVDAPLYQVSADMSPATGNANGKVQVKK